jgi:DDE superfamily endonuclease
VRAPIPPRPGQLERYDCEYKRNGTANLFVFLDVHRPWRKVKVTASRAALDFAACMRDLADMHFPKAARIRVVLDNLSTHSAGALYQTFPAEEARRLLRRLEFHYVPKHASWLNMVEIEIGVLAAQCLDRRIESIKQLAAETAIWEQQRNAAAAASNGCSQPKTPAPKWATPIHGLRLTQVTLKESKPLCSGTSCLIGTLISLTDHYRLRLLVSHNKVPGELRGLFGKQMDRIHLIFPRIRARAP